MSLNADLVRSRCADIETSVRRLERIAALGREQFLVDQDARDIASHRLLVAIEAALALCFHVCAKRLQVVPEEYAGCFSSLRNAGLIAPDLAHRLERMARFRNLLVHAYSKIDYDRVFDILGGDLEDLRRFAAAVAALL